MSYSAYSGLWGINYRKSMKLVCSKRNINNPTLDQISNEVFKLNNKEYFHTTLYLDKANKKYIRVHLKSKDQYIMIYCDGLSDNYLREEKANFTHNEIIEKFEKAINNDFSWVTDYSWMIFKRGDSLKGICKSITIITIITSVTICTSLLSIILKLDFYLGLLVILFPILNKIIDYRRKKISNVLGAQKRLNNLWKSFIFPSSFFIIARNVYLNSFWIILSYIFIFFILLELFALIIYQFTKPYSGIMDKPAYYMAKKSKNTVGFIIFRVILITMWIISSGMLN